MFPSFWFYSPMFLHGSYKERMALFLLLSSGSFFGSSPLSFCYLCDGVLLDLVVASCMVFRGGFGLYGRPSYALASLYLFMDI